MRFNKYCLLLLICFSINIHAQNQKEDKPLRLRIMTYNLRFGELASLEQLSEHIKAFKPDFVALQEVDCKTNRERAIHQNGKDFSTELGYRTGMLPLYGKSINYKGGYYGIGILSRFPYINVEKKMLHQANDEEKRVVLFALFEINEKDTIVFACTHLDYSKESTRKIQVDEINKHLTSLNYPVILGGDFNAQPQFEEILHGMNNWKELTNLDYTVPAISPKHKIDYIFGYPKNQWKVIRTQTIQSLLSDHLPIITEIELIEEKVN